MLNADPKDLLAGEINISDEVYFWNKLGRLKKSDVLRLFPKDRPGSFAAVGLRNSGRPIKSIEVVKVENVAVKVPEIMVGDIVAFKLQESVTLGEIVSVHGEALFLKDPINPTKKWSAKSDKACCLKVEDGKKALISLLKDM